MTLTTQTYDSDEWQLVPKKPTDSMGYAADQLMKSGKKHLGEWPAKTIYKAMLAAAPTPPHVEQAGEPSDQ